jgi:hypothetical protein
VNDSDITAGVFCSNKISNTKYNLLNFLPKNLWEQFGRFMNKYFLLIACLQLWPLITPVNPASTWGPLIFIFAVSASKEAWDDYGRYCLDKQANERSVWIVKQGVKTQVCKKTINLFFFLGVPILAYPYLAMQLLGGLESTSLVACNPKSTDLDIALCCHMFIGECN